MVLELVVLPTNVSFSAVHIMEVPEDSPGISPTGYFLNPVFELIWHHTEERGAGEWYRVQDGNFFLYDQNTKSNVSLDDLDFDRINKKMVYVMSRLSSSASKVWTENVFEGDNEVFADGDRRFAPLVAYKILFDLSERANEGVWNLYLMADASIIESIASALEINDDEELAKAFRFLHENASGSYERTEKFLADNKKYIQAKMVKYVKVNIDQF